MSRPLTSSLSPSLLLAAALFLPACGDKDGDDTGVSGTDDTGSTADSEVYAFTNASSGESSVDTSGQVFRHLLIADMADHLEGMTERLDSGSWYPEAGEVTEELNFYLEFDSSAYGSVELDATFEGQAAQITYDDVASGKNIVEKLAGNDAVGQHEDWETAFVGWPADGVSTPESLVRHWIAEVDAAAVAWAEGDIPLDPSGQPVPSVTIDAQGRDHYELLEKFLVGAVGFSQGTDDYLDDDTEGKGLLSSHTELEGEATVLEHAWDEAFGYFGAAITYPQWSDADVANLKAQDMDGDGSIDLLTEVNWGDSVYAARRDMDSASGVDFTGEAWAGFHGGRALLAQTAGTELSAAELTELQAYRDQAVSAWEASIGATVVHYANETLQDMEAMGTDDYDFGGHAGHWSEMKGYALSLQFNPRSPLSEADFAELHGLMGTGPVLADAGEQELAAYKADLLSARAILASAYGFDAADLGDDDGLNGW